MNASKIAHCKNDGKPDILHFLFYNQNVWIKGETIDALITAMIASFCKTPLACFVKPLA